MVKTLPSNAGGAGSILGWGAKIPHALRPKKPKHKKNRSNIVTNSIKTLKMVHIKKYYKKKTKKQDQEQTHRQRKQTYGYQRGGERRAKQEYRINRYTLLYVK